MNTWKTFVSNGLVHLFLLGMGFFMLVPFVWMAVTSLKDPTEALKFPPQWIPEVKYYGKPPQSDEAKLVTILWEADGPSDDSVQNKDHLVRVRCIEAGLYKGEEWEVSVTELDHRRFLWSNYIKAWNEISREVTFSRYFYVTIIVAVLTTVGQLITSVFAAYAFARLSFFLKNTIFTIFLGTMMVPQPVLLIPNFVLLASFGWLNTFYALIVPWFASVFGIFLLRQYFMTIPQDLFDAARIDGCGHLRIITMILLPLSKPILLTLALFTFIGSWNSFMWPLIVTNSPDMRTLQVGLASLQSESGIQWTLMMAASTFSLVPLIVIFFFVQKQLIESFARSGIKG